MNHSWENLPVDKGHFKLMWDMRPLGTLLLAFNVVSIIATGVGAFLLITLNSSPPDAVVATESGNLYLASPTPYVEAEEVLNELSLTVTESALRRNANGMAPIMREYLTPDAFNDIERLYADATLYPATVDEKGNEVQAQDPDIKDFSQSFAISVARAAPRSPDFASFVYEGVLKSRSVRASQRNLVYLAAGFTRGERTEENPTGWRLFAIKRVTERDMYPERYEKLEQEIFDK